MTAIVEVSGLYKFFETGGVRTAVLRDVSFALNEGEFLCVMGPSGSGKTTLLHLISGLDEPSAGSVRLRGEDLSTLNENKRTLRRRDLVGYVFQFFNLLPNLTTLENVGLPLLIQGQRPQEHAAQLQAILEKLDLSRRLNAFPSELSGGEMQRVSIARALAGGQPLLLCDEPTGNLSQSAGAEIMGTLRRLCDEDGRSVLLVTHNPRDATYADRVLFLVDGAIDPEKMLRGPGLSVEDVHASLSALHI